MLIGHDDTLECEGSANCERVREASPAKFLSDDIIIESDPINFLSVKSVDTKPFNSSSSLCEGEGRTEEDRSEKRNRTATSEN